MNNIAPGFVRSNPTTERQWESYGEDGQRALVESIALKRLGSPDDIAHAVLFFASDYAGLDHRSGALGRRRQVTAVDAGTRASRARITDRILGELIEFASIPSVSTDPAHAADMRAAASWVAHALEAAGPFTVRTHRRPPAIRSSTPNGSAHPAS